MLALLLVYHAKVKGHKIKRKQSLLLIAGFSVPLIGGIIAEIIVPLLFGENDIPITNSLLTVFSISSFIAIKKYKMLEYSPKHQWNKIMKSMNEGILIVDNQDRIMYANKMFCELLGYEMKEINTKIAHQFLFDDEKDLKKIDEINIERKRKVSSQYEIQLKKKTGEKIWVMASGAPYMDGKGNVIGSIAIFTNINALKQTETDLHRKEEKLIHTVDQLKQITANLQQAQAIAKVGNWELDFAKNKAVWSEEACRMYDIPIEEKNDQSVESWLSFIHPEDLDAVKKEVEKSGMNLCDSSFYHRILWKNKTVRHIHSVSKFKFDSAGKPIGIYGICHDITDLKESEEKLKVTNEELKTFIYKSSHDLRGPLVSILGLINIANMEITDWKALGYLSSINDQVKKLDYILLTLVQVMSVKDRNLVIEQVDMKQLLEEILDSLKFTDGFDKIKFQVDNQLTAAMQTDRQFIYSVMLNLIENSIKYRKNGISKPEINIRLFNVKKHIQIEVADNGIGIIEEAKDKVFDMFYRGNDTVKGSGLGLYLIKNSIQKLDGRISLESEKNVGTKFTITL
jgi:PAS domain S-box-containing protein